MTVPYKNPGGNPELSKRDWLVGAVIGLPIILVTLLQAATLEGTLLGVPAGVLVGVGLVWTGKWLKDYATRDI